MNLIKLVRLKWHMRKIDGGYKTGKIEDVVDAFIRAGIIGVKEREEAISALAMTRAAQICGDIADTLQGRRGR